MQETDSSGILFESVKDGNWQSAGCHPESSDVTARDHSLTSFTVSTLTVTTRPTRRIVSSGSSSRLELTFSSHPLYFRFALCHKQGRSHEGSLSCHVFLKGFVDHPGCFLFSIPSFLCCSVCMERGDFSRRCAGSAWNRCVILPAHFERRAVLLAAIIFW
jgi:hypothetical protein